MNNDVYKKHSAVYDEIANKILAQLDKKKMAELNAKVDVEGQRADDVAKEYLKSVGLY